MSYFLEVWTKPKIMRSTLDEFVMAGEVLLFIGLCFLVVLLFSAINDWLRRKK